MKRFLKSLALCLLMSPALMAQSHTVPTLDRNNTWSGVNTYTQSPQVPEPSGSKDAVPKDYVDSHTGGAFPHTQTQVAGDGTGNGVSMPEKQTTLVTGSPNTATVQCDEDWSNGRFDPRCTKYAGGVGGVAQGAAMQAFRDQLICYQAMTGNHAQVNLPSEITIATGTDIFPTLTLPIGAYYRGGGGWGFGGMGTDFIGSYNNHPVVDFEPDLTSSTACSDGSVHTSHVHAGTYDGISAGGCGQGGCVNAPGDSGSYPNGGPLQVGLVINDGAATVGKAASVYAHNNGADGTIIEGQDNHVFEVGGADNDEYFYFGMDAAGQNYQMGATECHADVNLPSLDGMFVGPFETYGTFMTLGAEYGHVAGVCWGGGNTYLGPVFAQLEEIGILKLGNGDGVATNQGDRIDASRGDGIVERGAGKTTYIGNRVIGSCIANPATSYIVWSVAVATPGSGQTPGTYLLTASTGAAQISVTVGAGGTVTTAPTVRVYGRGYTSTAPTFTLAAGGTPATFTVTMKNYQQFNTSTNASPHCSSAFDFSGGWDTWIGNTFVPSVFFGTQYVTSDVYAQVPATWIGNTGGGNSPNHLRFQNDFGNAPTGTGQVVVEGDSHQAGGGSISTGSVIDVGVTGYHVRLQNSSATTLTAINNANTMTDLWIIGDGFSTMPYQAVVSIGQGGFGAANCTPHDLLLAANRLYHFLITGGQGFGLPTQLTEICDSVSYDWQQVNTPGLSSLPPTKYMGANQIAGSEAVVGLPALADGTIDGVGAPSSFSYCFVEMVWVAGGKQANHTTCTGNTPPTPGSSGPADHTIYRFVVPNDWTRYQVIFQSTTDSAFTALLGVVQDVTASTPNPQPVLSTSFDATTGMSPTAAVLPTAWLGANSTGTYNINLSSGIPSGSSFPGVPGQVIRDVAGGFDYVCDTEDHWKRTAITWSTF